MLTFYIFLSWRTLWKSNRQNTKNFSAWAALLLKKRMPSQICVLHCAGSRQVSPKVVICKLFISANLAQFQNLFYNIPIHTHLEICAVKTLVAERSAQWSRKRGHVHELETLERLPHFTKCGTKSLSNSGSLAVSQAEFCSFLYLCARPRQPFGTNAEQLRDSPQHYGEDLPVIFRIQCSIDQSHVGMNHLFDYVHSHNRKMGEVAGCPQ